MSLVGLFGLFGFPDNILIDCAGCCAFAAAGKLPVFNAAHQIATSQHEAATYAMDNHLPGFRVNMEID
jgi:hypothetical protein